MRIYSDTPWLKPADIQLCGVPSWEVLDELASEWLGQACLTLPSIRVGLCWALEQRGYTRHLDHILVPPFTGRCILNSLSRFALPVESPTTKTRIALVVNQFGRSQDVETLKPQFSAANWSYIEDSPYGIGFDESISAGSLGRFIGLGKVLPVIKGALFVSGDEAISQSIKLNRQKASPWAWPVWLTMLALRKRFTRGYSEMADLAYEMYPSSRGGSFAIRNNLVAVFNRLPWFERESQDRMAEAAAALGACALLPNKNRLGYVVPFLPGIAMPSAKLALHKCGFSDASLHVDINNNMLNPNYVKCLVVPINPYIPRPAYSKLMTELRAIPNLGISALA